MKHPKAQTEYKHHDNKPNKNINNNTEMKNTNKH